MIANGSDIRPWWIYHHYLAMAMVLISVTWEKIKAQSDCSIKQVYEGSTTFPAMCKALQCIYSASVYCYDIMTNFSMTNDVQYAI
ncbi:hypothetical protein U9M48_013690 [Paspalum notatum var. saurae]|uniref:Uncharacterized protein n=1 Tax=Paspalum notatum var. saurae TaxID=547442 RepID=A0AAQ3WJS7_PASNO